MIDYKGKFKLPKIMIHLKLFSKKEGFYKFLSYYLIIKHFEKLYFFVISTVPSLQLKYYLFQKNEESFLHS